MKRLNLLFLWMLAFTVSFCLFVGCNQSTSSGLPVLDLNSSYPNKKISIQDVAKVTYIAFETDTNMLFSGKPYCITDHYFVCNDYRTKTVFFFDRKGKFVTSLNRFGEGPEEYKSFSPLFYDEKKDELYGQVWYDNTVKVYRKDGSFVRSIPFKEGYLSEVCDYDDNLMLCFNDKKKLDTQVYLLSKTDTSGRKEMLYTYPADRKIDPIISMQTSPNTTYNIQVGIAPLTYQQGCFLINDPSRDTVYRLTETLQLEPIFTRTPSVHSMDPAVLLNYGPENKEYLFLSSVERKYDFEIQEGCDEKFYLLDKATDQVYIRDLYNIDYPDDEDFEPSSYDLISGYWTCAYSVDKLLDALEKGKLSGPLKDVASSLKEDDNLVLMLIEL